MLIDFLELQLLRATPLREPRLLQNRVLESLRRAQAHHGLGLDLDRFAGLRIAAHAGLAVRFHNAADPWNDEFARGTLGFFHRKLVQLFKKESRLLLGCAEFFGDMRNDLGLAEWLSCHLVCLSSYRFFPSRETRASCEIVFVYPEYGEKTRAEGTIANEIWERKCNWAKTQFLMNACGKRGYFGGFF